jgi:hypothetical protein
MQGGNCLMLTDGMQIEITPVAAPPPAPLGGRWRGV